MGSPVFALRPRCLSAAVLGLLVTILPPIAVNAAAFPNLYELTVTPDPAAADQRAEALRLAMSGLLVRVTGRREASVDPALQGLVQDSARYLNSYARLDRGGQAVVGFNAALVDQALTALDWPVWGPERPLTLLWIAVDDGLGERALLAADEIGGLSAEMDALVTAIHAEAQAAGDERGLPIAFPLLDLQDMTAVEFADVWGGFDERVQLASARYGADAILIGRVRPGPFGNEVQCLLLEDGRRHGIGGSSIRECLDAVADTYAAEFSVVGGANTTRLTVLDVATLGDYGRVLSYLESLSVLQSVDVERLERGVLTLRVVARGDAGVLGRVLALGGVLSPAAGGFGSGSALTFTVAHPERGP